MRLIFLGSGGGRTNLVHQWRATGGFILQSRKLAKASQRDRVHAKFFPPEDTLPTGHLQIHVDPGPGALVKINQLGISPRRTRAIIVTHGHVDHYSDAPALLEAMTYYGFTKRGLLLASRHALYGAKNFDKAMSKYHTGLVCDRVAPPAKPERYAFWFDAKNGNFLKRRKKGTLPVSLSTFPLAHDEKTNFGFILELDGQKLGYISDTNPLPQLGEWFSGLDCLVISNLKPTGRDIPDHLTTADTKEILREARPKAAFLTHLGMEYTPAQVARDCARIRKEISVNVRPALDGYAYDLDRKKYARFRS